MLMPYSEIYQVLASAAELSFNLSYVTAPFMVPRVVFAEFIPLQGITNMILYYVGIFGPRIGMQILLIATAVTSSPLQVAGLPDS